MIMGLLTPGFRIGPYEIVSFLDVGSMGQVYRVKDTRVEDRVVAIKILPPEAARNPERLAQFVKEQRAIGNEHRPHRALSLVPPAPRRASVACSEVSFS